MSIKYFRAKEFTCKCQSPSCDAGAMSLDVIQALLRVREEWGRAILITSGIRCKAHNKRIGGAPNSKHLSGEAVDIWLQDANQVQAVAALAEKHGFRGIGTGKRLLHIDFRDHKARWTYEDR